MAMTAAGADTEKPVTIEVASRQLDVGRARLRTFCIAHGLAIEWGGTGACKRIRVLLTEVRRALYAQRVRPPAATGADHPIIGARGG